MIILNHIYNFICPQEGKVPFWPMVREAEYFIGVFYQNFNLSQWNPKVL